jgi:hypothetical protein
LVAELSGGRHVDGAGEALEKVRHKRGCRPRLTNQLGRQLAVVDGSERLEELEAFRMEPARDLREEEYDCVSQGLGGLIVGLVWKLSRRFSTSKVTAVEMSGCARGVGDGGAAMNNLEIVLPGSGKGDGSGTGSDSCGGAIVCRGEDVGHFGVQDEMEAARGFKVVASYRITLSVDGGEARSKLMHDGACIVGK